MRKLIENPENTKIIVENFGEWVEGIKENLKDDFMILDARFCASHQSIIRVIEKLYFPFCRANKTAEQKVSSATRKMGKQARRAIRKKPRKVEEGRKENH